MCCDIVRGRHWVVEELVNEGREGGSDIGNIFSMKRIGANARKSANMV